ncbi:MAG: glycoside hydrolase family 97 protein [Balneolaceae bacterium]|nr:glycoside hydrolase family 97 protein [Balneolaceae bacterium]
MKRFSHRLYAFVMILLFASLLSSCTFESPSRVSSPDGEIEVDFSLSDRMEPQYTVTYKGNAVIDTSTLGFEFQQLEPLSENLSVEDLSVSSYDETWTPVYGEQDEIRNHYNELLVELSETTGDMRKVNIRFRVYDDGLGFRYEFPEQAGLDSVVITHERTNFALTGDHSAWWIPADYDSYEYTYYNDKVSEIDASEFEFDIADRPDRKIANFQAVNTPVTMETAPGLYLSFHEADLTDYAGMTLAVRDDLVLQSELVPWADGTKVKTTVPFHTPWRTIQISEDAGGLAESKMILNLNEPNKLDDTSWIEPMKYTGIWWEMHIGKTSWGMGESAEGSFSTISGSLNHGANTENAKEYIDFNAKAGIKGLLIEGWNTGWEYWGTDSLGFFDFTTPYPDFDLEEVTSYAEENGVEIIGHHETSGQAAHYETRLDAAFQLYSDHGINYVKTGYAGAIVPTGERHHGQYMVRHYRQVVKKAAEYNIGINAHEPIKDTGIRRTYPNMMTREGVRGMEYNAWSRGNPPEHTTILPFTRVLGGPIDYTPGIFDLLFDDYRDEERVHSTLANQLALYVVLYSPMQMAADLPENYIREGDFHPMFEFIRDVPVNWQETHFLSAEIGDYVIVARKEKGADNWYLGAITDENGRKFELSLSFLDSGTRYEATIYQDGEDASWEENPTSYEIETQEVDRNSTLELRMAPGGGLAIQFRPI